LRRGTLILIVGPSGAGKDRIIAAARERFAGDPRLVFARRLITRPADENERHLAVTDSEFAELHRAGDLMLRWHAHNVDYGLSMSLAGALEHGHHVIANVSRTIIVEARRRFPPIAVVEITASPDKLAARLAARGRESFSEIDSRLTRTGALSPYDADFLVDNNGALATALDRFTAILNEILGQTAGP